MIHKLYMTGGPTFHHLMLLINLPLDKMSHSAELPANVVKSNDGYRAQVMALHKPIYSKTYRNVAEAAMRVPILVDIRNVFNKRQVDPTPSRGQIREICDKLHWPHSKPVYAFAEADNYDTLHSLRKSRM